MKITYATISKTGIRSSKEDAFKVIETSEKQRRIGVVCDGMGGIFSKNAILYSCNK